jgi:hypothetical protein
VPRPLRQPNKPRPWAGTRHRLSRVARRASYARDIAAPPTRKISARVPRRTNSSDSSSNRLRIWVTVKTAHTRSRADSVRRRRVSERRAATQTRAMACHDRTPETNHHGFAYRLSSKDHSGGVQPSCRRDARPGRQGGIRHAHHRYQTGAHRTAAPLPASRRGAGPADSRRGAASGSGYAPPRPPSVASSTAALRAASATGPQHHAAILQATQALAASSVVHCRPLSNLAS